jgi:crossover junction endodeoxyribonuclease RuvC
MRIVGLDPGLHLTGYAVIELAGPNAAPGLLDAGVIRLSARAKIPQRLVELETELVSLLQEHQPQVAAIEQLYAHYAHPRTAILMGHARGVLLLAAQRLGLTIHELAANRVKQAIAGHGHASKVQMQRAVQQLYGLARPPQPPDVADALAIALCCGWHLWTGRRGA